MPDTGQLNFMPKIENFSQTTAFNCVTDRVVVLEYGQKISGVTPDHAKYDPKAISA